MILAVVSFTIGALFAQRFKVLSLVPATLFLLIVTGGFGMASTASVWSSVISMIVATISIQVGYFVGLACSQRPSPHPSRNLSLYAHQTSTQNSVR